MKKQRGGGWGVERGKEIWDGSLAMGQLDPRKPHEDVRGEMTPEKCSLTSKHTYGTHIYIMPTSSWDDDDDEP